ncbi:hypothetical protein EVAR_77749_1 [Eumeta japonica]|uniref:Uncharacterized protein n=1 Tax=Eumeta variegata TaxID=151549 RepID=A0A4C1TAT9_EUMVA|nr:hypothetical protein EVAR_77749_1 [Eumeta japonica]
MPTTERAVAAGRRAPRPCDDRSKDKYFFCHEGDAPTLVRVNLYLRSISKIDDYKMKVAVLRLEAARSAETTARVSAAPLIAI